MAVNKYEKLLSVYDFSDYEKIKNFNAVIGIGGGQALDNAKFFSWKRNNI